MNKNGAYKYDYDNDVWDEFVMFSTPATELNAPGSMVLLGFKQVYVIQDTGETFATVYNINSTQYRFYSMQVYENNTLLANYVPASVNGIAGIYDTVAKKSLEHYTDLTLHNKISE